MTAKYKPYHPNPTKPQFHNTPTCRFVLNLVISMLYFPSPTKRRNLPLSCIPTNINHSNPNTIRQRRQTSQGPPTVVLKPFSLQLHSCSHCLHISENDRFLACISQFIDRGRFLNFTECRMPRHTLTIKPALSSTGVFLLTSRPCTQTFHHDRRASILTFQDNRSTGASTSATSICADLRFYSDTHYNP